MPGYGSRYEYAVYRTENNPAAHRRHAKTKRRALRKAGFLLFLFCCCFAVVMLVVFLLAGQLSFTEAEEPPARILPPSQDGANSAALPQGAQQADSGKSPEGDKAPENDKAPETPGETPWQLILVNKWNPIPDGYTAELAEVENGRRVDVRILAPLQDMLQAAGQSGLYATVVSGYRTAEEQQRLLDEKIAAYQAEGNPAEQAASMAEEWVAKPGTSEHQLGLAVDINADGIHSTGEDVYAWLAQNSHRFGFIPRYPAGKTQLTGVANEPWHFRYVGAEAAAQLYEQSLCLEEYV